MGRAYAGILGSLACAMVIARGLVRAASVEQTLVEASAALFVFATIGYVAGQIADLLIRDSVRTQFQSAMADWEKQHPTQP